MQTLIIYDATGYIIYQSTGNVREPIGVPFLWVEIPADKRLVSVDVSGEEPMPIYEDLPKSEVERLQEENLEIKLALAELAELIVGGTE